MVFGFALASAAAALAAGPAPSHGEGAIAGVVTSPIDGRGVAGVDVIVRHVPPPGATDPWSSAVRTDLRGGFRFDGLPPGVYSLDVIGAAPVLPWAAGVPPRVWTQVSPVVVVAGSTAVEQVVLAGPPPALPQDT